MAKIIQFPKQPRSEATHKTIELDLSKKNQKVTGFIALACLVVSLSIFNGAGNGLKNSPVQSSRGIASVGDVDSNYSNKKIIDMIESNKVKTGTKLGQRPRLIDLLEHSVFSKYMVQFGVNGKISSITHKQLEDGSIPEGEMVQFEESLIQKYVGLFGADQVKTAGSSTVKQGELKNQKFNLYKDGIKSFSMLAQTDIAGNLVSLKVIPIKK